MPENSRAAQKGYEFVAEKVQKWKADGSFAKCEALQKYAESELQCSLAQLAIAWCVRNMNVSTVLLGATSAFCV